MTLFLLDGLKELLAGHLAPGVDLLAVAALAADHGGKVELDGVLGDIDDLGGAEELEDALLNLVQGVEGLGVDLADHLLGAVGGVVEGGLVQDLGDVGGGIGRAAIAALTAAPSTTAPAALGRGGQDAEAGQGLDAEGSQEEATAADGDGAAGEDGLSADEGAQEEEGGGVEKHVHGCKAKMKKL